MPPPDANNPFGEYAPEPETEGTPPGGQAPETEEVESAKYGIGKPRRIIIRGTVAADTRTEGRQD